jgi:hypothetical protein
VVKYGMNANSGMLIPFYNIPYKNTNKKQVASLFHRKSSSTTPSTMAMMIKDIISLNDIKGAS